MGVKEGDSGQRSKTAGVINSFVVDNFLQLVLLGQ